MVESPVKTETILKQVVIEETKPEDPVVAPVTAEEIKEPPVQTQKVSALSLSSIRAKRELEKNKNLAEKQQIDLPKEPFTETDMQLIWTNFAEKKGEKGQKIIQSLMLLDDPKLDGTTIYHELPNESSKFEFEFIKYELLGALRGKLHNHDITIEIIVNETVSSKRAFTPQERFNRLNEINPNLEVLRKMLDLDF